MNRTKILILGSTFIVSGLAIYLFLKNRKNKTQSESQAKNELIIAQLQEAKNLEKAQNLEQGQNLEQAKIFSKKIAEELIAKSRVKRASSKAGADKAIQLYTQQMAQLGYKPLINGGVEKI